MTDLGPAEDSRFKRRRLDWDIRGVLAVLSLLGTFGYAVAQMIMSGSVSAEVPPWMPTITGTVIAFYFGGRSSNGNGSGR